jgi:hypothetical protein
MISLGIGRFGNSYLGTLRRRRIFQACCCDTRGTTIILASTMCEAAVLRRFRKENERLVSQSRSPNRPMILYALLITTSSQQPRSIGSTALFHRHLVSCAAWLLHLMRFLERVHADSAYNISKRKAGFDRTLRVPFFHNRYCFCCGMS